MSGKGYLKNHPAYKHLMEQIKKGGKKRRKSKKRRRSRKRSKSRKNRRTRRTRRRIKLRKSRKRRKTRRRKKRMRGGGVGYVSKNKLNFSELKPHNTKVMDPPVPGITVKVLQKGGGALDIIPGYTDLKDMYYSTVVGGKNIFNKFNGDRLIKSPLPSDDQYVARKGIKPKFPDIGGIHEGAEAAAAEYRLSR